MVSGKEGARGGQGGWWLWWWWRNGSSRGRVDVDTAYKTAGPIFRVTKGATPRQAVETATAVGHPDPISVTGTPSLLLCHATKSYSCNIATPLSLYSLTIVSATVPCAALCCALQERYKQSLAKEAISEYEKVAKKHGLTPTQLALAWCKSR